MKCSSLLIAILICVLVSMLAIFIAFLVKYRHKIAKNFKKHQIIKFTVNVIIPFLVPFIISIVLAIDGLPKNNGSFDDIPAIVWFLFSMSIIAFVNLLLQLRYWIKECKEADLKWENEAYGYAYNNLFQIHRDKGTQLRTTYHHGLRNGSLTEIPYDVFIHIRKICWEFCGTVSQITGIPPINISASFIYRYTYDGAGDKDKKWRWVSGKGSKFNIPLNDFVQRAGNVFHYMINSEISYILCNDKKLAVENNQYTYSYRDNSHDHIGSFLAAKVAFSCNTGSCCEGIIMVNSYGQKFLDNDNIHTEQELSHLILDKIFPCYRHLLQTELGMLYFRHVDESEVQESKPIRKISIFNREIKKTKIETIFRTKKEK